MPPMHVHADDIGEWIVAVIDFGLWRYAKITARLVAVNTIEDFAFVKHDWFTMAVRPLCHA